MFSFLGVAYFPAAQGKLCSETGNIAVDDLTVCKEAAQKLSYPFRKTENYFSLPKGCHVHNGGVYFNQHAHGSAHRAARQICIGSVKGMGVRSFITSMPLLLISYIQLKHQWII